MKTILGGFVTHRFKPRRALSQLLTATCALLVTSAFGDTTLVSNGSPARILVPTDGSLGGTWRSPSFNDSSWIAGNNGVGYEVNPGVFNASVIADSQGEWSASGQQGENSWINGYYDKTGDSDATYQVTDFQPFPRSAGPWSPTNFWTGGSWDWFAGDPPWDTIGSSDVHPNGINNAVEHWVIRRWHSTASGAITLRFHVRKANGGGTGVTGKVFKNGVEIFTRAIAGSDTNGFQAYINTTAAVGDVFDFAHSPVGLGDDPSDGADGSHMTATILSGTIVPPQPPVGPVAIANSMTDWSGTGVQGANNWFYGYYNRTADGDGVYDPNADFNNTDPNWTFSGGNWQLGVAGNPGANPPWDTIGQSSWHPNGDNQPQGIHWVIRRWVSEVDGEIHARVRFAKANTSGNGTTLHVLHNGTEVFASTLNTTAGIDTIVTFPGGVFTGDKIEFALDPRGTDGLFGDGSDSSTFSTEIFTGPPPQATVADSVADWSSTGVQGANGWSYGFYNETLDGDATYSPATDFNTSDPNWSFLSGSWQLGAAGNPGANPPWDTIAQTEWHPNGDNNIEVHWMIRRWVSDVDGDLHASVQFGKQNINGGNGTTLRVLHNGNQVFSHTVSGTDGVGINRNVNLPGVLIGDTIEFALDPLGTDGSKNDGADGSFLRAAIKTGLAPEPPRPFLPGIADCFMTDIETAMKGVNPSVFIRIPFDVSNPADIETLKLKIKYNDGFAAYLNGTEIAKRNAPTTIAGITVADSVADWSTNPDVTVNGWSYGYYSQTLDADGAYSGGSDMTPFPHDGTGVPSATEFWTGNGYDWFMGNPPWTELFQESTHPNHPNANPVDPANPATHIHWTVRRWNATVDANLKARIRFRKTNASCGDGVRVDVFHNSVRVYSQTITGTDAVGRDDTIDLPDVFLGDNIDILLGPGDANDFCDGSAFSMVLFEGEPAIPWNGAATATRTTTETITPSVFDISSFISQLAPGRNVLAIQGINAAVSDNEFLINAELLANQVPTAVNDAVAASPDTTTTYPALTLLANDTDPDGDRLVIVGVNPDYTTAQGGTVRLFGDTVRYTPAAGFTGADSFDYTMTDQSGTPVRAAVSVTVSGGTVCPANITANNDPGQCGAVVTFTAQGATSCAPPSGATFNVGTTTVSCTGPGGQCTFTVTVVDNQPPAVTCPTDMTVECGGNNQGTATFSATATDNCGAVTVVCVPPSGSSFPLGPTTVNCTGTDAAQNQGRCSFVVTVRDTTNPTVTCPSNITVPTQGPNGAEVTFQATGSDTCGGVTVVCVPPSGSTFPNGSTPVTCTATDAAGGTASCTFTVTVRSANEPPVCAAGVAPGECVLTFGNDGRSYVLALDNATGCMILTAAGSSDPDGDPLTYTWTIDGATTLSGATVSVCLDAGCHTVELAVSDGHQATLCRLEVCIIGAGDALEQCITLLDNADTGRKNKRPLLASLKAAQASFDRGNLISGSNQLKAFQNKVRAQIERENPAAAAELLECVNAILEAIACSAETELNQP